MSLVKGPFRFKWGANEINNVSNISVNYSVATSNTSTLDGNQYTVETGMSADVTLTLLENDIASLAMLLPQFYVATGEQLSTGQTVTNAAGAIDVKAASCTTSEVYNPLDIYACGTNAQVLRLVNCRTQVDSIDLNNGLRTVLVKFIGEPASGDGVVQFLTDSETFVS